MTDEILKLLLGKLGQKEDEEYEAISEIKKLGYNLPFVLLSKYRSEKKWQVRDACVYHSIGYAKNDYDAFQMGIEALSDKSKKVRYHACLLLSFSLRTEALPILYKHKSTFSDTETINNIIATIDAIENQNTDYFVDRRHTGNISISIKAV